MFKMKKIIMKIMKIKNKILNNNNNEDKNKNKFYISFKNVNCS